MGYGTYGTDIHITFPAVDSFLQLYPLRGSGELTRGNRTFSLTRDAAGAVSPDEGYSARYSADYECIVLKVDAQALTRKLAAITGKSINTPLRFASPLDLGRPAAKLLHDYLPSLIKTLNTARPPFATFDLH